MYKEHILNEFQNNTQIIYLDSSCLIRHYPLSILSKNFTRGFGVCATFALLCGKC